MRVVVLGCGSIGRRHLRNLVALNGGPVFAFDVAVERRREARALGIQVIDRLEDVWERRPQVVFVTAGTDAHLPLARAAAAHGCHLFIEKPLAATLDGVTELAAEVKRRGLVTMVGCNMRFHPGPLAVKRLIDAGSIGAVIAARIHTGSYLPGWRPGQDYRDTYSASPEFGGAILDCIHEIDLALWYLGPAALVAAAHVPASTLGLETDGLAEILLRHDSGALSSVHLNFVQRDYHRGCQIIGGNGTIYWDFGACEVRVFGPDGRLRESVAEPVGWHADRMFVDEAAYFLECVTTRRETFNDVAFATDTLRLALAARQGVPALGGAA